MKRNRQHLKAIIAVALLAVVASANLWAQEEEAPAKRNSNFSITPAVSFSWYPYAAVTEESTVTDLDMNNIGISALLSLKLFDKIGASVNLTIDDPTFQKLVDIAGYVNAYDLFLNFNIRSFGGTVGWDEQNVYNNPIPDGQHDFRTQWTSVSLLYNFYKAFGVKSPYILAFGLAYTNFSMPVEYRANGDDLTLPGFGNLKGDVFGVSILIDTLVSAMETDPTKYSAIKFMDLDLWIYSDFIVGFGTAKTDDDAIQRMAAANGVNSIDTGDMIATFIRYSQIVGIQKVWAPSKNVRIGLAVGADLLYEILSTDLGGSGLVDYVSASIGPAVRLSFRF